jgi:outer membrane lipoprotein SlyB
MYREYGIGPDDTLLSKYQQRAQNHPARPQTPGSNGVNQTQENKCSQAAYAKANNAEVDMMINNAFDIPKETTTGAATGAISGCVASAEVGCFEGAFFGGAMGATLGAVKGSLQYIFLSTYQYIQINEQLSNDLAACKG